MSSAASVCISDVAKSGGVVEHGQRVAREWPIGEDVYQAVVKAARHRAITYAGTPAMPDPPRSEASPMNDAFAKAMTEGYALDQPSIVFGSPMVDGEVHNGARVQVALSILNRHGLIAGATGTGKTKTLQLMAGQLSKAGVPTFVADIKGDLTGMVLGGDPTNPKITERMALARPALPAERPPGRVPVADRRARRPGTCHGQLVRAAAAGQGARPE